MNDWETKRAVAKFREFHRVEPTAIGAFAHGFRIPSHVYRIGDAVWVTYLSRKVDPETLKRPRRPQGYIHEHDAGVVTYVTEPPDDVGLQVVDVPADIRRCHALTLLGECLGFCFRDQDGEHEVEGTRPLPELYTIPSGEALLVIQSKRTVLAMMWGGALGVFGRGIDG